MAGVWYLVWFLDPIPSAKQFPGAIQHAKYIMKHAGMKGYEKAGCKLRKYEKSKLQHALVTTDEAGHRLEEMLRSLVALLQGAGGLFRLINMTFG